MAFSKSIILLSLPRPFNILSVSVGRLLANTLYASIIAALLVSVDAPQFSAHFADDVAFRAAWITVTQVPLVYILSAKKGPLNLFAGLSYERINWMHRWVGRVMFLCATTHMSIMMSSISISELMRSPEKAMSVVRYGAGAYATLSWIAISSILPLRTWSYRSFCINHFLSSLTFLWAIANHVPKYARLPIYTSVGIIAIDQCLRGYGFLWNNISIRPLKRKFSKFRKRPSRQVLAMGHPVKMMTPFITNRTALTSESTTVVRICDVPFSWRPGQHVRVYLPKLGAFEMHPFTPATCSDVSSSPFPPSKNNDVEHNGLLSSHLSLPGNDMVLMIKAHHGLTRRLADYHSEWLSQPCPNSSRPSPSLTAFLDGPYGNPPTWEDYESIVLVATSTGVSFILSILDYLEQLCFEGQARLRTQQIRFIWINRHVEPQFEAIVTDLLLRHTTILRESDIRVEAEYHFTCTESNLHDTGLGAQDYDPFAHLRRPRRNYFAGRPPLRIRNPNAMDDDDEDESAGKVIEPRISEAGSRSSCETYTSSTLIDDDEDAVSDIENTLEDLETSCWDRMPSLRLPAVGRRIPEIQDCQCELTRRQEWKCKLKNKGDFVERAYGSRPDVPAIVAATVPRNNPTSTMITVCSNQGVARQMRGAVAALNKEYARGIRDYQVELYIEGYG